MERKGSISFYIYKDLRASQNGNPEGHSVPRFDSLEEAIAEFNHLPKEWTTALGIHIDPHSEIDLVQRREGEPVLVGDYQRIPVFYGNADVQSAVRTLLDKLHLQWQSEYRVFDSSPVLIPIPENLDFVRDRTLNGKHLAPADPRYITTSIEEMYVPEYGWTPMKDVYDDAEKYGYYDPHIPKVTSLHAHYTNDRGTDAHGDISAYNYILLKERTRIMECDEVTIKRLAEAVEDYIYRHDPAAYQSLFGTGDRHTSAPPGEYTPSYWTIKDHTIARIKDLIKSRDLATIIAPITASMERGLTAPTDRMEARELLGRILNIPEDGEKKLPIDLRVEATEALDEIYRNGAAMELKPVPTQVPSRQESR